MRYSSIALVSLLLGASMFAQSAPLQASCSYTNFVPPPGYYITNISGIDSNGFIVGELETSSTFETVAFIRNPSGSYQVVQAPNSLATYLTKRNSKGVNVGFYQDNSAGQIHGYILQSTNFRQMDYPGAAGTWLSGVNVFGTMVGSQRTGSVIRGFELRNHVYYGVNYPGALETTPAAISDTGEIAGSYADAIQSHGFYLLNGTFTQIDHPQGNLGTELNDVNSSGVIVGNYESGDDTFYGFIYKNGQFENLTYPGASNVVVGGINNNGVITGIIYLQSGSALAYTATCQ